LKVVESLLSVEKPNQTGSCGAQVSVDIEIIIPLIIKFRINGCKKHKIKRDC
jgi:hypothetical protein